MCQRGQNWEREIIKREAITISIVLSFFVILLLSTLANAQVSSGVTRGTTTCNSAVAAVQVVPSVKNQLIVTVPLTAGTAVWFPDIDFGGTCSSVVSVSGKRITAGNGWEYVPSRDKWNGAVCCILESAGSVVITWESK